MNATDEGDVSVFMNPDETVWFRGDVRSVSMNGIALERRPGTDDWFPPKGTPVPFTMYIVFGAVS